MLQKSGARSASNTQARHKAQTQSGAQSASKTQRGTKHKPKRSAKRQQNPARHKAQTQSGARSASKTQARHKAQTKAEREAPAKPSEVRSTSPRRSAKRQPVKRLWRGVQASKGFISEARRASERRRMSIRRSERVDRATKEMKPLGAWGDCES